MRLVALLTLTTTLTSCQAISSLLGSAAIEYPTSDEYLTKDAVRRLFPPIRLSQYDSLTYGTACQMIEHNARVWCMFPETQPKGFPTEMCLPGVKVCEEALGPEPTPPSPPSPAQSVGDF
jgi:hypothetical protein